MDITNRATATEWVRAWGGRPRPGILEAATKGIRSVLVYAKYRRFKDMEKDTQEALEVLTDPALLERVEAGR